MRWPYLRESVGVIALRTGHAVSYRAGFAVGIRARLYVYLGPDGAAGLFDVVYVFWVSIGEEY